jgi:lytic murein transglycosylase
MTLTRRSAISLAGATALGACVPSIGGSGAGQSAFRPVPNAAYDAWLAAFRGRALAAGITEDTLRRGLRGAGFLPGVVERDRNQTEFRRSTEDYLALVASPEDVALGRPRFQRMRATLDDIEARYGVPPQITAAIWGVETAYGTRMGDIPVISATSTLAFDGRRGRFFEAQLIAALRIVQNRDTTPDRMLGSWAGAMGHTQLMPTVFEDYAVDFRGDGRRDIWSGDATDGLASTANYLARYRWQRGVPWGMEVLLPDGFDRAQAGYETRRPISMWRAMGVRSGDGSALPDLGEASLHAPGGTVGFLLTPNFRVIMRYNPSVNYAIGVGHLSDRLAGAPPIRGTFGPDATGLTQDQRRQLQARLNALGYDVGTPDGVIGRRTETGIRAFQRDRGLEVTGQPSPALLARLG